MKRHSEQAERPEPIPWRRVIGLLRPIRGGLAAMVGLSVGGVLVGLVPAFALGVLVNALVERNDRQEAALLAGLITLAIVVEAIAYVMSDGMYARNAARLYRNLRLSMFDGARRRTVAAPDEVGGLPSRFISDAETIEQITVGVLDSGSMALVQFGSALIALGLLAPWTVPVVTPILLATWFVMRRMQQPVAVAGQRRQEELESMSQSIVDELARREDARARPRFRAAIERLLSAEVRLGWLQAVNLHLSGGLAKLGPIAVVVVAAFAGVHRAGTLISLYLLAQRVFWGFDSLVDISLSMQRVRGAVARCFTLIDTSPTVPDSAPVGTAA